MRRTVDVPGFTLPGVEDITRREFLIGSAGLLVLGTAACSEQNDGGEDEAAGEIRTVRDAYGLVEVPARPQRVAVLGNPLAEAAVVLEAPLVAGPPKAILGPWFRDEIDDDFDPVMSNTQEINVEALALTEPDLIVAYEFQMVADLRDQLREISPLFAVRDPVGGWREELEIVAEALGETEAAERVLSRFDARLEGLSEEYPDMSDLTCSVIATSEAGSFRFFGPTFFSGDVVASTGMKLQGPADPDETNMSLEKIPEIEADLVFYWDYAFNEEEKEREKEARAELTNNPLWRRLEAVREERVFMVGSHWNGSGPIAANLVLDDIESALGKVLG